MIKVGKGKKMPRIEGFCKRKCERMPVQSGANGGEEKRRGEGEREERKARWTTHAASRAHWSVKVRAGGGSKNQSEKGERKEGMWPGGKVRIRDRRKHRR